jgi:hypothetical protein
MAPKITNIITVLYIKASSPPYLLALNRTLRLIIKNYWGYDGRNVNDCEAVGIDLYAINRYYK